MFDSCARRVTPSDSVPHPVCRDGDTGGNGACITSELIGSAIHGQCECCQLGSPTRAPWHVENRSCPTTNGDSRVSHQCQLSRVYEHHNRGNPNRCDIRPRLLLLGAIQHGGPDVANLLSKHQLCRSRLRGVFSGADISDVVAATSECHLDTTTVPQCCDASTDFLGGAIQCHSEQLQCSVLVSHRYRPYEQNCHTCCFRC